ncbi:ImmA/IrrE family metallo-endopeptidase [Tissierella sp. Yu-01]|uniref:ImmA/IrrE family metallo-endopeptidase n=1 Tax=Tissierella sp. Yu-01 TaxID=3035694 RepID=UPI00240D6134|nr:ImmA/IrrE family metallo-endopeptidase [Tissierella sp. Yu-01]WFA10379.1 ImmA/IrrE family metallo-endopeptidase [Tissierella sp. Yu-01]
MSLSWIDEYINGVIEYCSSRDIFEIYDSLSINIRKVDKDDLLLRGNDAVYVRNFLGIEAVFIRDDLPLQYEKFVLAHELGHAILHVEIATAAYSNKLINRGKLERQADYFAIKLLDIKLDDVYHYELTARQIAGGLCVSEVSLEYIK